MRAEIDLVDLMALAGGRAPDMACCEQVEGEAERAIAPYSRSSVGDRFSHAGPGAQAHEVQGRSPGHSDRTLEGGSPSGWRAGRTGPAFVFSTRRRFLDKLEELTDE